MSATMREVEQVMLDIVVWILLAATLVLIVAEAVTTTMLYGSLALGMGAALLGAVLGKPLVGIFAGSVLAASSLWLLRPQVLKRKAPNTRKKATNLIGTVAIVSCGEAEGLRVEVGGEEWGAENPTDITLLAGQSVTVVETTKAGLIVTPKSSRQSEST